MTLAIPCGLNDSGQKKNHLKAIVIQTVRLYTNYSAMSLSCSRDITSIKTHIPNNFERAKAHV